ncbi:CapA family protein [Alkalicoccus chagannorensis]|uniref:CapA family protein n=1 Tax=Alkalicoccus chagannorensis TaxID=427072 RepID=UPI000425A083|nr:CapA family protein [Alkalicoccus chagannorensis]
MKTYITAGTLLLLGACQSEPDEPTAEAAPELPKGEELPLSSVEDTAAAERLSQPDEPIDITFAGDIIYEWSLEETAAVQGPYYPFEDISSTIQEADYAIANLETAVTEGGTPYPKTYNFRMPPSYLQALEEAGFDFVSIANNHTMDYGEDGLLDTVAALDASALDFAGAGENKEAAYAPHTVDIDGTSIAVLAFSEVLPAVDWYARDDKPGIASGYQHDRTAEIIEDTSTVHDYTLVYMHWGNEGEHVPEQAARDYARLMADAGADAIVGAHPHVLQGFEYIDGTPVAYSLGNFLFPDYVDGPTAETGLLQLQLDDGEVAMRFEPWWIEDDRIIDRGSDYQQQVMQFLEANSYNTTFDGFDILPEEE